jgi:DNA-binding transcriptional LysR family regulator
MQWADRIGRRIKLRDLHVLLAVAEARSISRAAELLAISHPVVSRTISELEQTLGVRLFDRSSQGVSLTMHGQGFLDCAVAVFDDLRSGVQRLEVLSDPSSGEVRIGGHDVMMAGFIPTIIDQLARKHGKMAFHSIQGDYPYLRTLPRERKLDAIVARRAEVTAEVDLTTEVLFRDPLLVVAGPRNRWIGRRKIDWAEVFNEPWIMPEPDSTIGVLFAKGLRSMGWEPLKLTVMSNSIQLRNRLLATGRYLSVLPRSSLLLGAQHPRLRILPIRLPEIVQPIELITLKNRTLSPTASLFIERAREIAKTVGEQLPVERLGVSKIDTGAGATRRRYSRAS